MILDGLLEEFQIEGLSPDEVNHLNRVWHRLTPWPDAIAGLTRLRGKFTLATLSNGNIALLVNMAKNAGLPWDAVLSSELAGHYKPDSEVYQMAVDLLGLEPGQVMMVAAAPGGPARGTVGGASGRPSCSGLSSTGRTASAPSRPTRHSISWPRTSTTLRISWAPTESSLSLKEEERRHRASGDSWSRTIVKPPRPWRTCCAKSSPASRRLVVLPSTASRVRSISPRSSIWRPRSGASPSRWCGCRPWIRNTWCGGQISRTGRSSGSR